MISWPLEQNTTDQNEILLDQLLAEYKVPAGFPGDFAPREKTLKNKYIVVMRLKDITHLPILP